MSTLQAIRQHIVSVTKTRQVTQAMEKIATVRMVKAKKRAEALRPYAVHLRRMVARMLACNLDYRPPWLDKRVPSRRLGMVVITTDKGMCGALNTRLLHQCIHQMLSWQQADRPVSVTVVGSRGLATLRRAGARIVAQAVNIGEVGSQSEALLGAISVALMQFVDGEVDEVYLASNRFINVLTFEPRIERLLPLDGDLAGKPAPGYHDPAHAATDPTTTPVHGPDYLYEPSRERVIDQLLLRWLETVVYQAVAENAACEHCARRSAMQSATRNADRMLDELKHTYHKTRQEAITRELIEVVAGADSLSERG